MPIFHFSFAIFSVFNSRIAKKPLAAACRSLSTLLHSGVPIRRAFEVTAAKSGNARCRRTLQHIARLVGEGEEVADALQTVAQRFPPLMLEMVRMGEETGALPEVLRNLAEHFENHLQLRRDFYTAITWPVIQFTLAVLIIGLLIYILGWIAQSRGGKPIDILGWGLSGSRGALIWFALVGGTLLTAFVVYHLIVSTLSGRQSLHRFVLNIPVLGNCMRSFAIARFSWAFYLTQQTGMPMERSLRISLRATNNGAFIGQADSIGRLIRDGEPLGDALRAAGVFPNDFLAMVDVAEAGGTVPEALHRLSPQFQAEARRTLSALTTLLGWGVWLMVAIFIIFLIFRIAGFYVGMLNNAVRGS